MELSGYTISIFGLACYFLPGLTFTLLFKGKQHLAELVVYTAILSIGFSTILGMVFGGLGILDKAVYAYLLFLGLVPFALRRWGGKDFIMDYGILLCSIIVFTMNIYFQDSPVPRGWDATDHYVKYIQIYTLGGTPGKELTTLSPPYYPRGYHYAAAVFALLTRIDLDKSFRIFNSIIYSIIPPSTSLIALNATGDRKTSIWAAIFSLPFASIIVARGQYPFTLSVLLFIVLSIEILKLLEDTHVALSSFIAIFIATFGLIATHVVYLEYVGAVFISGLVLEAFYGRRRRIRIVLLLTSISMLLSIIIYVIFQSTLLQGQYSFFSYSFIGHLKAGGAFHTIIYRENNPQFILYILSPYIAVLSVIGIVRLIKDGIKPFLLAIIVSSVTFTFSEILTLMRREPYLLLPAIPLLSAIGVLEVSRKIRQSNGRGWLALFKVIITLTILYQSSTTITALKARSNRYIDHSTLKLAEWLRENFKGQVAASLKYAGNSYIELVSGVKILQAKIGVADLPSRIEISRIFEPNTSLQEINSTIQKYNVTIVIVNHKVCKDCELIIEKIQLISNWQIKQFQYYTVLYKGEKHG